MNQLLARLYNFPMSRISVLGGETVGYACTESTHAIGGCIKRAMQVVLACQSNQMNPTFFIFQPHATDYIVYKCSADSAEAKTTAGIPNGVICKVERPTTRRDHDE